MNYLIELIIRPARNLYHVSDLGDATFSFAGQEFKRIDFNNQIRNERGERISCSFWCPIEMSAKDLAYSPCIVYCHGNAGNKIDIIEIFEFLLWDFNICSIDFSGAGYSEGDFVTLGYFEKDDVKSVVDFLRRDLFIQKIILYGRSMGAVSSLRYAEMDPNLKAVVLDSPFSNFSQLCEEILSNKFYIPGVVSRFLINMTRNKIMEKIPQFDIYDFIPLENAKNVQVPTIMIHGIQDSLVNVEHSRQIFKNLHKNTYKKLLEVEGEHNDTRSKADVNIIREFIMQFAYDSLILKEHKRRLNIKNAHLNFTTKYGININSVISTFKSTMKSQNNILKQEKRKMNNFNIHGQMKKTKISSSKGEDEKSLSHLRSKSSETTNSKISRNNKPIEKIKDKRDNSNNSNLKTGNKCNNVDDNYNTFSIKIVKPNEYSTHTSKKSTQNNEKITEESKVNNDALNKTTIFENNRDVKHNMMDMSFINPSEIDMLNLTTTRGNTGLKNKKSHLRSDRNNTFADILGCDVRLKSNQIKFTNVDKTSMRKRSMVDIDSSQLDISLSNISTLTDANTIINTHTYANK